MRMTKDSLFEVCCNKAACHCLWKKLGGGLRNAWQRRSREGRQPCWAEDVDLGKLGGWGNPCICWGTHLTFSGWSWVGTGTRKWEAPGLQPGPDHAGLVATKEIGQSSIPICCLAMVWLHVQYVYSYIMCTRLHVYTLILHWWTLCLKKLCTEIHISQHL